MKFLVDAQLPIRLAYTLTAAGHDCIHTTDMRAGNRSTDLEVSALADSDDRVVVSKGHDFRAGHLLRRTPRRLLIVATGNISNRELLQLFGVHLREMILAFEESNLVEIRSDKLLIHSDRDDPATF